MAYETNDTKDHPFGFLMDSPAGPLIDHVRQTRAARMAAQTDRVPSFGEVATERRAADAEEQQMAAELPQQAQAQQQDQAAAEIKFLVDTKNGEFEPVLPGQPDPQPGPSEILMTVNPQDPSQPNILATGKRVTSADIARLGNPEKQIKPTLKSSYQLPPEMQHLAESLGITKGAQP